MIGRSLHAKGRAVAVAMLAASLVLFGVATQSAATVITAAPNDFTVPEQATFNGEVASFTDDNPSASQTDFTATIDWGDGSATTGGAIFTSDTTFVVFGQHTYADEGSFTVTVTISDQPPGTGTATATSTATVTEADVLSGSPVTFSAAAGVSFTGTVAKFSDQLTTSGAGDFTATIDWGDATTSAGTVSGSAGSFDVSGTHTYAGTGTFSVTVTLSDDAPGTAMAQVTSTAHVGSSALFVTPVDFSIPEHSSFNGTVATFIDSDKTKISSAFTTSIDWGDGTSPTAGTVSGGSGSFTLTGQHTYADERKAIFTVTVSENPPGTATATAQGNASAGEADVLSSGSPVTFSAFVGTPRTGTVANFTDSDTVNTASDFTAIISWGDGTSSAGTVSGGSGSFSVSGTHTYANTGNFPLTVQLTEDAPGTAKANAENAARVTTIQVATIPTLDFPALLTLGLALSVTGLYLLRKSERGVG